MKYVLVIDVADDIAEDYEDFTVDYDFRGTPKENPNVNESIKYIENAEPRPLPEKLKDWQYADKYNRWGVSQKDIQKEIIGYNLCVDEVAGENE